MYLLQNDVNYVRVGIKLFIHTQLERQETGIVAAYKF